MRFAVDIQPLFRASAREVMQAWFDLWDAAEVAEHAEDIVQRLEEGDMPCDRPWAEPEVARFRA